LQKDKVYRYKLLKLIFKQKYYLSPEYFNFDASSRFIYSKEFNFGIQLNFNFINVDIRYILFILSIMQLQVLEIIEPDEAEKVINIIANVLDLRLEYRSRKRVAIFKRWIADKLYEEWILSLTSEEFNAEVESMIIRSNISLKKNGFSNGPDTS